VDPIGEPDPAAGANGVGQDGSPAVRAGRSGATPDP
jgi:hypothetical protein